MLLPNPSKTIDFFGSGYRFYAKNRTFFKGKKMGNKAVITTSTAENIRKSNDIGLYIHWNGGRDSIEAFLAYCRICNFPPADKDGYGWGDLARVIGNYGIEVDLNKCCRLDCKNGDHGVYIIEDWKIVGRKFKRYSEQNVHDLREFVHTLDERQTEHLRLGKEEIEKRLDKLLNGVEK